ncbi:MAG: tetratricopeptide repeat protein [Candidatus Azobacteroides sp.]|nr:tetratricopeptide repeat protein [Candidatus Azobacteroides sp.]
MSTRNERMDKMVVEAEAKMNGLFCTMLEYLHTLHNAFPKESLYLELLAKTYLEAGRNEEALEYCSKALKINPAACKDMKNLLNLDILS